MALGYHKVWLENVWLVVGVITSPQNQANRDNIRASWMSELRSDSGVSRKLHGRNVQVRFVVGDVPCALEALAHENATHLDIAFVRAEDCRKGHSAAKVHAWFAHALVAWPSAKWLAKTEDDSYLWLSALTTDLRALSPNVSYVGLMGWTGGCTTDPNFCAPACWGGAGYGSRPACEPVCSDPKVIPQNSCCEMSKAERMRRTRMTIFASGMLDVRRRAFAQTVANCEYARRFFDRSAAWASRGTDEGAQCQSTDGSQGFAIAECGHESLTVADTANIYDTATTRISPFWTGGRPAEILSNRGVTLLSLARPRRLPLVLRAWRGPLQLKCLPNLAGRPTHPAWEAIFPTAPTAPCSWCTH